MTGLSATKERRLLFFVSESSMSEIIYRSTICDFEHYCVIGRKYRLCAEWGVMQHWFRDPEYVVAMSIAYHLGIPVGMAMLMKKGRGFDGSRVGVFVRRAMRRQGVGKRLVSLVKKRTEQGFLVCKWYPEQIGFFNSLGMRGYQI